MRHLNLNVAGLRIPGRFLTVQQRIDRRCQIDPITACKVWLGATDKDGYGRIRINGDLKRLIRVQWELIDGPIPRKDAPRGVNVIGASCAHMRLFAANAKGLPS